MVSRQLMLVHSVGILPGPAHPLGADVLMLARVPALTDVCSPASQSPTHRNKTGKKPPAVRLRPREAPSMMDVLLGAGGLPGSVLSLFWVFGRE